MSSTKKQPLRSCTACGLTANKQQLVRFVRKANGEVFCDGTGKAAGRGAYICNQPACFEQAQKKNRLSRALKCNINSDDYGRLQSEFTELCSAADKTNSKESAVIGPVESTE